MANHGDVFVHVKKFEVYDEVRGGLHTVSYDMRMNEYFCESCHVNTCFHVRQVNKTVEVKRMDAAPIYNKSVILVNRG